MAKPESLEIEKPAAAEPHPSEKLFAQDHPELAPAPAKDAKKSEFEKNLDKAVKTVVEELPKEESTKVEQPAKEEETPSEEKPSEAEAAPEETKDDKGEDIPADVEAKIKDYAEKNGITEDQAKAEIEEYEAIAKKYDNDPVKIAKAYKNMQSEYDKQKAQDKLNQQTKLASEIISQGAEEFVRKAEQKNAPQWVAEFKKFYPAQAELMTDAAILEKCREVAISKVNDGIKNHQITLKKESDARRDELIKTVRAEDRPFVTEISKVLKGLPDIQIIDKGFNMEDVIRWARGDAKNIKKREDEAYQRGIKAAQSGEILGEKFVAKPQGGSKPKPKEARTAGEQISSYEKNQAKQMYASLDGTDEDRYAAYLEFKQEREAKKKK